MHDFTSHQQENLHLIRDRIGAAGLPPAPIELAQRLGFGSVHSAGNRYFQPFVIELRRQEFVIEGIGDGVLRQGMKS